MSFRRFFHRFFFRDRPAVGAAFAVVLAATGVLFCHAAIHLFAQLGWMYYPVFLRLPGVGAALALSGAILSLLFLFSVLRRDLAMRRRWAVPLALAFAVVPLLQFVVLILAVRRRGDRRAVRLCAASLSCALAGGVALAVGLRTGRIPFFWLESALVIAALFLHLAVLRRFGPDERGHRGAAVTLAVVVALGIASWPGFHAGRLTRLADAKRTALAERLGVDLAASDPDAALPADLDYALFKAAQEDLSKIRRGRPRQRTLSEEDCAAFEDWCARHADFLVAARALTEGGSSVRWHFPDPKNPDQSDSIENDNDHFGAHSCVRSLLLLQGRVAVVRGDIDAYRDAERRLAALARSIAPRTTLMDSTLGDAADAAPFQLLGDGLAILAEEDLVRAERAAASLPYGEIARLRAQVQMRFRCHGQLVDAVKEHIRRDVLHGNVDPWTLRYSLSADELRIWDVWKQSLDLLAPLLDGTAEGAALPEPAYFKTLHERDAILVKWSGNSLLNRLSPLLLWNPEWMTKQYVVKPRLRADIVRTGIAVERFRRAHGALPASLEELVPGFLDAVPADFRTGTPFDYETGDIVNSLTGETLRGFRIAVPQPYLRHVTSLKDMDMTFLVPTGQ